MQVPRAYHSATALKDGRVLVAGGCTAYVERICSKPTGSAELYNPSQGTWSKTASMNLPRFGHAATLLPGGKVLVVGGCTRQILGEASERVGPGQCIKGATAEAELYDPKTARWSKTAKMSRPRNKPIAVLLPGKPRQGCGGHCGKVVVVGDPPLDASGAVETDPPAELYDPRQSKWVEGGKSPVSLQAHLQNAAALNDATVLFAGPSSWIYTPANGTWSPTVQAQPVPHIASSAPRLKDGRVLLISEGRAGLYDPVAAPDPARPGDKGAWKPAAAPQERRNVYAAIRLLTGEVLLAGGKVASKSIPSPQSGRETHRGSLALEWSAELYDPRAGRWRSAGPMAGAHADLVRDTASKPEYTSTLLKDGRVLVAGGALIPRPFDQVPLSSQNWKALDAAEVYTPEAYDRPESAPAAGKQSKMPLIAVGALLLLITVFLSGRARARQTMSHSEKLQKGPKVVFTYFHLVGSMARTGRLQRRSYARGR